MTMTTPIDEHLSELALDRIAGGEAPEQGHITACGSCRALLAERQLARQHFAIPLRRPAPRRRAVPWAIGGGMALLAAALALIAVRPVDEINEISVRAKGTAAWADFDVFIKRPDAPHAINAADGLVVPGDTLQWLAGPAHAGHVAIYNIDGTGARAQVHPPRGGTERLEAGPMRPLSSALTLDDAPGPEHIIAVFCPQPFDNAAVLGHLVDHADDLGSRLPEGCVVAQRLFTKNLGDREVRP